MLQLGEQAGLICRCHLRGEHHLQVILRDDKFAHGAFLEGLILLNYALPGVGKSCLVSLAFGGRLFGCQPRMAWAAGNQIFCGREWASQVLALHSA